MKFVFPAMSHSARLLLSVLIFMLVYYYPACKNPFDFEPDDTLFIPPAAPRLLSPPDSFVRMPGEARLLLTWEAVKDAEIYEIRIDGDTIEGWTIEYDTNAFSLRLDRTDGLILDRFTWKVRAGSGNWQYYTEWSKPGHFEVRLTPPPPELIYPPDETTFIFDSLPAEVDLEWAVDQDEQYYDINMLMDSFPYLETRVLTNSYSCVIDGAATYYWQVRAGSSHWESPSYWSELRKFTVATINH